MNSRAIVLIAGVALALVVTWYLAPLPMNDMPVSTPMTRPTSAPITTPMTTPVPPPVLAPSMQAIPAPEPTKP